MSPLKFLITVEESLHSKTIPEDVSVETVQSRDQPQLIWAPAVYCVSRRNLVYRMFSSKPSKWICEWDSWNLILCKLGKPESTGV